MRVRVPLSAPFLYVRLVHAYLNCLILKKGRGRSWYNLAGGGGDTNEKVW